MKKKKILLGLALAAAAVFSLASCGDDTKPADNGGSQVTPEQGGGEAQTQKYSVTYHTTHGTAPAAVANVTTLPATLPTLTDAEYDFVGWAATENGTEVVTAGATITKNTDLYAVWLAKARFTVTYHTTHGTAPEAVANVKALPETLPTLTDEEFNFGGWATTENGTLAVAEGTAITANADLYAIWTEKTAYEKVATSADTIYVADFATVTVADKDAEILDGIKATCDLTDKLTASIADGKLTLTDTDDAKAVSARIYHNLAYSGVVEGDLVINFSETKNGGSIPNKQDIVQFNGLIGIDSETKLFALRSSTVGKLGILLNGDDGNTEANYKGTLYTWEQGKDMEVYYKYDFATGKLTVKVNGTLLDDELEIPEAKRPIFLTSVGFTTASSATTRGVVVSKFAVKNSGAATVEETKTIFSEILEDVADELTESADYSFSVDEIAAEVAREKGEIAALETKAELISYLFTSNLSDIPTNATLKDLQITSLNNAKSLLASNYTVNADDFDALFAAKIAAFTNATTKADYEAALTGAQGIVTALEDIKSDTQIRSDAMSEFVSYAQTTLAAIQALNLGTDDLAQAMNEYGAISLTYGSSESSTKPLATCDITLVADYLAEAEAAFDALVVKYSLSLEDLVAQYNDDIAAKVAKAKEDVEDSYTDNLLDGIAALVASNYSTKDEAKTAYEATLASIQAILDRYAIEYEKVNDVKDYKDELVKTLLIDTATYNSKYRGDVNYYLLHDFNDAIRAAVDEDAMDVIVDAAKTHLREMFAAIHEETEAVVTFKKNETDTDAVATVIIIKGDKVTAPNTEPTLDGLAFAGWDFDFDDEIDTNTTIVAKWHDTYESTAATTSTATFKGMTALPVVNEVNFGAKGKTVEYVVNGITYTSTNTSDANFGIEANGLKMNKANQKITFTVPANSTVTFVLRNGKSDGTRAFNISSTSGLQLNNIIKGYTLPTGTTGVTVTNGKALDGTTNEQECTKIVITCTTAQTLTIECAGTSPNTVHIQQISVSYNATIKTEIKAIKATVNPNNIDSSISISDVKLVDIDDNEIVITEGYTVYLDNSETPVTLTDGKITNVAAGEHTVTIKYGSYTVYTSGKVEIKGDGKDGK